MTVRHLTSLSLLDRLKNDDDREAWELFVSIYRPFICRYLTDVGVAGRDIDDLAQDTITGIFEALHQFEHNGRAGAFRKWLRTIAVRRAQRWMQKRHGRPMTNEQLETLSNRFDESFEQQWDGEHNRFVISRLLKLIQPQFTRTTWLAFQLHVVESLSVSETAERLGCSTNTVLISKSRVMRALRKLGRGIVEC